MARGEGTPRTLRSRYPVTTSGNDLFSRVALWVTLAGALVVRLWYVLYNTMPVVDSDAFNYDGAAVRLCDRRNRTSVESRQVHFFCREAASLPEPLFHDQSRSH